MTFPGPDALGRGLVVLPGAPVPAPFDAAVRVRIDDAVLADPTAAADVLHDAWSSRRRTVVELAAGAGELRTPEREERAPFLLGPGFTFERERLHFLVWANTYDARKGVASPVWWHGVRASRLGARLAGPADVVLPDGTPAWCDGGPRRLVEVPGGPAVVHRDSIDAGLLTLARARPAEADLAADQLAAVTHPGGPARIIAPAGSGKTRVLTERIRHLIVDRGYEPGLVTAVAYNVLAADQLRERTEGFRPTIRTLNSLGLAVCQRRGTWRVAEERAQREILSGLVHTGRQRRVNTDPLAPYLDALSAIRLGLVRPEEAEDLYPDAAGVAAAFPAYRERLAAAGLLDFDEQIYRAIELLLADPQLRAAVRAEARTLLVDEFQDLTPAHLLLIRLVAGPAADVFGVGDDDQVIYGYAGADPGFLIDFERYFPGAASYDLHVNYRCPPDVVEAARRLLGHNRRRIPKDIRAAPGRDGADGEPAAAAGGTLIVRAAPAGELGPVAVEVIRHWAAEGVAYEDIAVLTRVNSSLLPVQVLLTDAGIPCLGAVGPWILDRAGTAAALAYLRIATGGDRISRADVRATVRRPSRRISPKVVEMLTRDAVTSLRSIRGLARWMDGTDAFAKEASRVDDYADDLEGLADAVRTRRATTAELLTAIRDDIGLGEAMETLDLSKGTLDRSSNGDDLAALLQVAALHPEPATFEPWLRETLTAAAGAGVHLATVHRVKGREWRRVAVFGADAGLFPHRLAGDVEEERRIFHVAVTRGRERVAVLADEEGPSPFVGELTRPARAGRPSAEPGEAGSRLAPSTPGVTARHHAAPVSRARPGGASRAGGAGTRGPRSGAAAAVAGTVPATLGLEISVPGGLRGTITEIRRAEAGIHTGGGSATVDFGASVRAGPERERLVLTAPSERVEESFRRLKAWRLAQSKAEDKPAFMVLSDAHLRDIAERDPDTPARLARCKGIGPAKLDAYGEAILAVLDE